MRQQAAATQQLLQAPFQQQFAGGMGDWRGSSLPHQPPGLALTGAFHHLALQQCGGVPLAPPMGVMAQAAVHMQQLLPQPLPLQQQQQPLSQQQQQQLLQLQQSLLQQQWQQVPGQHVQYLQSHVQIVGQSQQPPVIVPAAASSRGAAAGAATGSMPLPGNPSGSDHCPFHVQLPKKLSGFQSLSHVWAWYTSPMAEAGNLSPKELEKRYESHWRTGKRNRQMWCHVMNVVRAVQQRVGTAVSGSHRGAQLDERQIVTQLDAERGAVRVATYIRKKLSASSSSGELVT
jgi:hypothetical protein